MVRVAFEVSGGTLKARPIELAAADENSVLGYFQLDAQRPGATIHQHGFQRWVVRRGKSSLSALCTAIRTRSTSSSIRQFRAEGIGLPFDGRQESPFQIADERCAD